MRGKLLNYGQIVTKIEFDEMKANELRKCGQITYNSIFRRSYDLGIIQLINKPMSLEILGLIGKRICSMDLIYKSLPKRLCKVLSLIWPSI